MKPNEHAAPRTDEITHVMLVGAGVVGRAIAIDHLRAGIEVWMVDQSEDQLRTSCDQILNACEATADSASPWGARVPLPIVHLFPSTRSDHDKLNDAKLDHANNNGTHELSPRPVPRWLLIESIAERLDVKQSFFADAETWFERPPVLTSNTSTLPIGLIASSMRHPERLCGLHFFMPVVDRPAAEIIPHGPGEKAVTNTNQATASTASEPTASEVIDACSDHARRLNKSPLLVRDAPGFVVNRLLAPYLNLATDLLCGGVDAKTIRSAALRYGMPSSPLELIDLIGTRTAFDGGRVVWGAFPGRMDPSPLLPALVKRKQTGVAGGAGFYSYDDKGRRVSDELSPLANDLIEKYHHDEFANFPLSPADRITLVTDLFAAVLRSEAIAIDRDGVADLGTVNAAMRGGLRWNPVDDVHGPVKEGPVEWLSTSRANELARQFPKLKSIQLPS